MLVRGPKISEPRKPPPPQPPKAEKGRGGVKGGAREGNWFRTVHPRAVVLVRIRTFVELAISLYIVPQAVLRWRSSSSCPSKLIYCSALQGSELGLKLPAHQIISQWCCCYADTIMIREFLDNKNGTRTLNAYRQLSCK